MNIIYDLNKYKNNQLFFLDTKKNMVMDGNFTKLLYSDRIITVIGLFFRVNFANTVIHTINNKHILKFDNCSANQKTIAMLSTIEKDILNYYTVLFQCNKKKSTLLGDYLSNGSIKVYLKNRVKNDTNYIIKISGVWENENEIGITYKLLEAETLS
jgi:hypothetical protein